jgi:hypothetical protein
MYMNSGTHKISPALFLVILFCFLLPFVSFSCAGQEFSVSGLHLVTGISIDTQRIGPNPLAIISLIVAISGLVFGFVRFGNKTAAAAVMGASGFITTLLMKFSIDKKVMEEGEGFIGVNYGAGFYLTLILFLAAAVVNLYLWKGKTLPSLSLQSDGAAEYKFCPQCGDKNSIGNEFCSACGSRFTGM